MAGLHATIGILAALRHRERTGEGQLVEVDLLSTTLFALANQASGYLTAGVVPGRMGNRHPSIAPYETLPTADGPIVVAVGNDAQFRTFCVLLGRGELADDPRFATNGDRVVHRDALGAALAALLAGKTGGGVDRSAPRRRASPAVSCTTWRRRSRTLAPWGWTPWRAFLDPTARSSTPSRTRSRCRRTPPRYRSAPPRLGEHADEVRAERGTNGPKDARRRNDA